MALSLLNLLKHCFPSVRTWPSISVRFYSFFFGKNVVQPRRDPFHEATGLSVSHNTSSGFLTWAESESAMATARQHDLIGTHIDAGRPSTSDGRGGGKGKEQSSWCSARCRLWQNSALASPNKSALGASVGYSGIAATASTTAAASIATTTAVGWWAGCILGDLESPAEYPSRLWSWSW